MKLLRSLLRDTRAATAAEFALVLPVALLFMFGIIDVGRYTWQINQAEKAAQMGVRFAVVTDLVETGIKSATFVGAVCNGKPLTAGDTICSPAFSTVTCTNTACNGCTSPCSDSFNATAFNAIRDRMRAFAPWLADSSIDVIYSSSGLGFAGDPSKPEVAPIVTVRLHDMTFRAFSLLGTGFTMPTISRSQTLEDGVGTQSN